MEKYLKNKDENKYGICRQCSKKVYWSRQKLESHQRSGNCLGRSLKDVKEVTMRRYCRQPISPLKLETLKRPQPLFCGSEEEPTETRQQTMSSEKANDYISFLRQFLHLGRYEKKRYLKFRAPDHFICILRECVRNVKRGVIQCDKALIDACNSSYSCGRIDENSANHSEARNLFCTNKTMVIVSQLLPTVITHLQSFTRNI